MTAVVVTLALAVAVLGVLVVGLLRSHAEILKALHDLGAGLEDGAAPETVHGIATSRAAAQRTGPAPASVQGLTPDGEHVATSLLGRRTLLVFLSTGCTTCQAFWEAFRDATPRTPGDADLLVLTRDLDEESPSALRDRLPGPDGPTVLVSSEAWDAFGVPGSPYVVLVEADGRVLGEGSAATWPAVTALMDQALRDSTAGAR